MNSSAIVVQAEHCILQIRGQKVILSHDIAQLYGVETKVLNQAVKRNAERFPEDFMFQLTEEEFDDLRSQFVTSSWGGSRVPPYAFTEQGVAMLSSVLNSPRAVQVNIAIMRTFVRLREMLLSNADLARKLVELEKKYDHQFKIVFDAIRQLMEPPQRSQNRRLAFIPKPHPEPACVRARTQSPPCQDGATLNGLPRRPSLTSSWPELLASPSASLSENCSAHIFNYLAGNEFMAKSQYSWE